MVKRWITVISIVFLLGSLLPACTPVGQAPVEEETEQHPEWFDLPLTNAKSGGVFTINDFRGKVVLVETMAIWCPNCVVQANEVRKLHEELGDDADLISVSLDVDVNETTEDLRLYVEEFGFDWYYAVAYLEVARALGNLYGANYLNPPISPMVLIDRDGQAHKMPHGQKDVDELLNFVQPFLEKGN